jgi:hydrogenase expression/formation protein HypC
MCLAIPMQVIEVNGAMARCSARGIERDVSLFLLQEEPVVPGDFVMVHVGYAIQKVAEPEARTAWALYEQMDGQAAGGDGDA